jgi:hypothetical protein
MCWIDQRQGTVDIVIRKGTFKQLRRSLDSVAEAPNVLEAVRAARRLREEAEALELEAVIEARRHRATWSEIGAVYGTSKQGAQQRFRAAVQAEHSGS